MGKGRAPTPSASTAVCDDDQIDTDTSALHVQVSMAQRDICCLPVGLYMGLCKQAPEYTPLRVQ